jgi:hypothetical protein
MKKTMKGMFKSITKGWKDFLKSFTKMLKDIYIYIYIKKVRGKLYKLHYKNFKQELFTNLSLYKVLKDVNKGKDLWWFPVQETYIKC